MLKVLSATRHGNNIKQNKLHDRCLTILMEYYAP